MSATSALLLEFYGSILFMRETSRIHKMGSMSIVHWMIVAGVAVLLFGKGKISDLMGDVAQGIKSFKKGMQDDEPSA
jgi:TatA/E family protein of Tat protein translocase